MSNRLKVFQDVVAKSPRDPFPYYCLAQEYRSLGRAEEALQTFSTLHGLFPDYIPQYLMAAQLSVESKDIVGARSWAERGIDAARGKRDQHALGELESLLASLPAP